MHASPVTRDETQEIERLVNEQIYRNAPVVTDERSTQEAMAAGAMALFGEKYGDRVRVVSIPGFSMELCGGTHCPATGDIGFFTIVSESGVAAGVRRIEAVTGDGAVQHHQKVRASLEDLLEPLGTTADRGRAAIEHLQAEAKRLARTVSELKTKIAMGGGGGQKAAYETVDVSGVRLATTTAEGLEKDEVRTLVDSIRNQIGSGVVLVTSSGPGKVSIVASVSRDLTAKVSAGELVKRLAPIVGGRGGGRPDFAEAGGKDEAKVAELRQEAPSILKSLLDAARD